MLTPLIVPSKLRNFPEVITDSADLKPEIYLAIIPRWFLLYSLTHTPAISQAVIKIKINHCIINSKLTHYRNSR